MIKLLQGIFEHVDFNSHVVLNVFDVIIKLSCGCSVVILFVLIGKAVMPSWFLFIFRYMKSYITDRCTIFAVTQQFVLAVTQSNGVKKE